MRVTRSATRKAAAGEETAAAVTAESTVTNGVVTKTTSRKRKAAGDAVESVNAKKARAKKASSSSGPEPEPGEAMVMPLPPVAPRAQAVSAPTVHVDAVPTADGEALVPAVLTFSFEEARRHLVGVDPRFGDVFRKCRCKPYEELERVDPFRCVLVPSSGVAQRELRRVWRP